MNDALSVTTQSGQGALPAAVRDYSHTLLPNPGRLTLTTGRQDNCSKLLAAINLSTASRHRSAGLKLPVLFTALLVNANCSSQSAAVRTVDIDGTNVCMAYLVNTVSESLQVCIIAEGIEDKARPAEQHNRASVSQACMCTPSSLYVDTHAQ